MTESLEILIGLLQAKTLKVILTDVRDLKTAIAGDSQGNLSSLTTPKSGSAACLAVNSTSRATRAVSIASATGDPTLARLLRGIRVDATAATPESGPL